MSTKVCITFNKEDEEKLEAVLKDNRMTKIPELIRFLINDEYRSLTKNKRMYGGSGRLKIKAQLEEALANLRVMNDEDLTLKLIELGYLEQPSMFNTSTGAFSREIIFTLDNGDRVLRTEYYNPDTDEVTSYADTLMLTQVLNEVKRQKLL